MNTVQTFLDMGGYGGFVWPAFAVTAVVLLALAISSLRSLRAHQRALARLQGAADGVVPREREVAL